MTEKFQIASLSNLIKKYQKEVYLIIFEAISINMGAQRPRSRLPAFAHWLPDHVLPASLSNLIK